MKTWGDPFRGLLAISQGSERCMISLLFCFTPTLHSLFALHLLWSSIKDFLWESIGEWTDSRDVGATLFPLNSVRSFFSRALHYGKNKLLFIFPLNSRLFLTYFKAYVQQWIHWDNSWQSTAPRPPRGIVRHNRMIGWWILVIIKFQNE